VKYKQLFFRVGEVRDENRQLNGGLPELVKNLPPGREQCPVYQQAPLPFHEQVSFQRSVNTEEAWEGGSYPPIRSMKSDDRRK